MRRRSVSNSHATALARAEALSVHERWVSRIRGIPVSTIEVAGLLGIEVKRVSGAPEVGRLLYSNGWAGGHYTIIIRDDLPSNMERFVMAHEIGHAVLLKRHPNAADHWDLSQREAFATTFAQQVLVPPAMRDELIDDFRALDDPISLLDLADRFGLWPHTLLRFADQESRCMRNLPRIWVRAKHRANRYTGLEPKLRIVTAHYDREHYFIPPNQSLSSFCGGEAWLAVCETGKTVAFCGEVTMTERHSDSHPKFRRAKQPARLSATRLSASVVDRQPSFLILTDLTSVSQSRQSE